MEAENHVKDGTSLKIRISRGIVLIGIACLFLSSCSSPEKDGIKAAKMLHNCARDYDVARNKAYVSYIKNFKFETRVDAREKLNETSNKVDENYQECSQKATEYHDKLKSKYITNKERTEKFEYALRNAADDYSKKRQSGKIQEDIRTNQEKIREMILSVIPPKPNMEKLKNDLIGRTINNQTSGYSNFRINSIDELKEVEILNATDSGSDYLLNVNLRLQGTANQWVANINVKYVLGHYDDWRIEEHSGNMNIVRTGKYDNCIKTERFNFASGGYVNRTSFIGINFINQCEEDLLVIGVASGTNHYYPLLRNNVYEDRFERVVKGNNTSEFRGIRSGGWGDSGDPANCWNVTNYEIHFIERAGL